MPLRDRVSAITRLVPRSVRRVPGWAVAASVPIALAVLILGVWVAGAALTDNAATAMALTTVWFAVIGAVAFVVALRWRALALPVLLTVVLGSVAIGGYLFVTSTVDRVVDEDVLVAEPVEPMADVSGPMADVSKPTTEVSGPVVLATGNFEARAHETMGKATLLERAGGGRVLTLTDFATDPGPDLRVYLVRGDGSSNTGSVDLGALKGNKGDQQYDVPSGAPEGAVVIWCRAFTVAFGSATL